jgi:hypothetical protein
MSHHFQLTLTSVQSLTNLESRQLLGAFGVPEISQPSSAIEFGEGSLDLSLAVDVEDINTLDFLLVVASTVDGNPAPRDFVAAAKDIQSLEIERGLLAGAGNEIGLVCKGD